MKKFTLLLVFVCMMLAWSPSILNLSPDTRSPKTLAAAQPTTSQGSSVTELNWTLGWSPSTISFNAFPASRLAYRLTSNATTLQLQYVLNRTNAPNTSHTVAIDLYWSSVSSCIPTLGTVTGGTGNSGSSPYLGTLSSTISSAPFCRVDTAQGVTRVDQSFVVGQLALDNTGSGFLNVTISDVPSDTFQAEFDVRGGICPQFDCSVILQSPGPTFGAPGNTVFISTVTATDILAVGPPLTAPVGIALSKDNQQLFVTDSSANAVFTIPTTGGTPKVLASGGPLVNTRGIATSPDGSTLFIAGFGGDTIISLPSAGGTPSILASGSPLVNPHGIAVSPDGSTLYIADSNAGAIFRLPVAGGTPTILTSFGTGSSGPNDLKVSPDGATLFIDAGYSGIFTIPTAGGALTSIATFPSGLQPLGLALSSDGKKLYFVALDPAFTGLPSEILTMSASGGKAVPLLSGAPLVHGGFLTLSQDNRTLYVADVGDSSFFPSELGRVLSITMPTHCCNPPSGLVSWWPGEGNANDVVGTNNGQLVNGVSFAPGVVGQAFSFDGTNQYVDLGNSPSLQVSHGNFTVDAWVSFNSVSGDRVILDKIACCSNLDGWALIKQADNLFWFCLGGGSTNGCVAGTPTTVTSVTTATTGIWYNVAVVKAADTLAIYVDGNLEGTINLGPFTDTNSTALVIGGNPPTGTASPNGLIDEPEIYNRALSAAEIQTVFHAGSFGKCRCVAPPSGLVSWWPLDGNANDVQDGNSGTVAGSGGRFVPGEVRQGFQSGGPGSLIRVNDTASLTPSSFTINAWARINALTVSNMPIVWKGNSNGFDVTSSYGLAIFGNPGSLVFPPGSVIAGTPGVGKAFLTIDNGTFDQVLVSSAPVPVGTFVHFAASIDGSKIRLYVNGQLDIEANQIMKPAHSLFPFQIGSANGTSVSGLFFDGVIDELQISNRALTASEVQSIFNAGGLGQCKPTSTVTWTQLSPSVSPPARFADSMTYDVADGYVLLFGGYNHTNFLSDTWKFKAGVWTQLSPSISPPPRYYASMTYDVADNYVLLFGGGNSGGLLSDTWEFKAGIWTQLSPSVSPSPRITASMAYDPADGYVLLFGGTSVGRVDVSDTWEFKAGSWTQLSPSTSPSPRDTAPMAYDAADGHLILFGGSNVTGLVRFLGDTWEYQAGAWTQLSPSISPSPRETSSMAYDATDGQILLFGEENMTAAGFTILGDTWKFQSGSWTQLFPAISPSPRSSSSMAFDGTDGYVLLFGGEDVIAGTSFQGDTWKFGPITNAPGPADFAISANPTSATVVAGAFANSTITLTGLNGFTDTINLSTKVLAQIFPTTNLVCTLSPSSLTLSSTTTTVNSTLSCSGSLPPFGISVYDVTVTGTGSTSGKTHSTAFAVTVQDFSVSANPASVSSTVGVAATTTIVVSNFPAIGAFSGTVSLKVATNSTNLSCTLSPTSVSGGFGDSTLSCTGSIAGNYNATVTGTSSGLSHSVTVTVMVTAKATPTITSTVAPNSITIGGFASDLATLTGGSSPTGTVTYTGYSDSSCLVLVFTSATVPLGSPSSTFTPSSAGTYLFVAAYSGDANNNSVTTTCGATGETLTVQKATATVTTTVSPSSITLGGSATDLATIAGGHSPTGTVIYTAYSDSACVALVFTSANVPLGTASSAFTPSAVGSYFFKAAYNGDSNNNAVNTVCGALGETLTVNPGVKATPTITSTLTPASITIGGSASDLATLAGGSTPTGTVTYTVYSDSACTTLVFTSAAIPIGSPSAVFTPSTAGTYFFIAAYGGDANNNAVATACGGAGESLTVGKASPNVTAAVSPASIVIGGSATDLLTVTGGFSQTGTVTYTAYSDSACTTLVFTSASIPLGTPSGAFTPSAVGTYFFITAYSGDANNAAITTLCGFAGETLTVTKATPTVTTSVSPSSITLGSSASDLATVSGGFSPAGTVTYTAYSDAACTTLVFTSATVPLGSSSGPFTPTATGTYYFIAAYSGDPNNNQVTSACNATGETLTVSAKATPTITSTVTPSSITIGGTASDLATVTGGSNPTGTVTYTAYSDSACTTLVFTSSSILLGTNSGAFTPSTAGTYLFKAAYGGDAHNNGATTACGTTGETLTVNKASPTLLTLLSSNSITIGNSVSDTATLHGGFQARGTLTYYVFTNNICAAPGRVVSIVTVTGGVVPASRLVTFNSTGDFGFQAAYSGDVNNNSLTSTCEPLTVSTNVSILTALSATTITVSGSVTDSATLAGQSATAGGRVTYTDFANAGCTGAGTVVSIVTVSNGLIPNSRSVTFNSTGSFSFQAVYSGDANDNSAISACEALAVTPANGKPVLLTFSVFDADDFENGVGQLQVLVNGHLVVDLPAGLNHLIGSGDYAPYDNTWVNLGPFDISGLVVPVQNTILFKDPQTSDHFARVRNVEIVQGNTILFHAERSRGVYPGFSFSYTFSNPPLAVTDFTASTSPATVGQAIIFTATYTGGTGPFKCIFHFGDGGSAVALGVNGVCTATHHYEDSGSFAATVTITGSSASDRVTGSLNVKVANDETHT